MSSPNISIAIHGGAGTILRARMTTDLQTQYESALTEALNTGYLILESGGSSLDAVEASVRSLEDCPLFNAGRGAVFNHEGRHEMDASIMDGRNSAAGAVCGVSSVRNPITLARAVMESSEHVLLCGSGAEAFARTQGLTFEEDAYFYTMARYQQLQEAIAAGRMQLDHTDETIDQKERKFGTVGAVALDFSGNLAAATSTGGMTNKQWGRIGDSPIIGAGTWASNDTCAVSCTGHGEYFIRAVVGHDIHCLMAYKGMSLQDACNELVHKKLLTAGGEGGLIAVDKYGSIAMPFNSDGMYRACRNNKGRTEVLIYANS
jgi:beta-aspartyl-peptidase (threonine type)